jgi:hypothetical protein
MTTKWAGNAAGTGENRRACTVLVGKPEENRPLERHRRKLEDNIKMDHQEIEWERGLD